MSLEQEAIHSTIKNNKGRSAPGENQLERRSSGQAPEPTFSRRRLAPQGYALRPSSHELMSQDLEDTQLQRVLSQQATSQHLRGAGNKDALVLYPRKRGRRHVLPPSSSSLSWPPDDAINDSSAVSISSASSLRLDGDSRTRPQDLSTALSQPAQQSTTTGFAAITRDMASITGEVAIIQPGLVLQQRFRDLHIHNHHYTNGQDQLQCSVMAPNPPPHPEANSWYKVLVWMMIPLAMLASNLIYWVFLPLCTQLRDELVSKLVLGYAVSYIWSAVSSWLFPSTETIYSRWSNFWMSWDAVHWFRFSRQHGGMPAQRQQSLNVPRAQGAQQVDSWSFSGMFVTWSARLMGLEGQTQRKLTLVCVIMGACCVVWVKVRRRQW